MCAAGLHPAEGCVTPRDDLGEVSARLAARMVELVRDLTGAEPTQRGRDTWRWRGKGSLSVEVTGPRRGLWHDHEAGTGGDALALIAKLRCVPLREAISWARGWLGEGEGHDHHTPPRRDRPQAPPEATHEESSTLHLARTIWRECIPARGSIVETYLAGRGLELERGTPIRFHPSCPRGAERLPAMVALMTHAETGQPCGVHRTFLTPDGCNRLRDGKGKMMAGNAGVIRLEPNAEVTKGLGLAEGIETALAVMQGFGWRPVWAATSAGAVAHFPVLPGIEALTIFADADGKGLDAARACIGRWTKAGREARVIAPPTGDFNDMNREAA